MQGSMLTYRIQTTQAAAKFIKIPCRTCLGWIEGARCISRLSWTKCRALPASQSMERSSGWLRWAERGLVVTKMFSKLEFFQTFNYFLDRIFPILVFSAGFSSSWICWTYCMIRCNAMSENIEINEIWEHIVCYAWYIQYNIMCIADYVTTCMLYHAIKGNIIQRNLM